MPPKEVTLWDGRTVKNIFCHPSDPISLSGFWPLPWRQTWSSLLYASPTVSEEAEKVRSGYLFPGTFTPGHSSFCRWKVGSQSRSAPSPPPSQEEVTLYPAFTFVKSPFIKFFWNDLNLSVPSVFCRNLDCYTHFHIFRLYSHIMSALLITNPCYCYNKNNQQS